MQTTTGRNRPVVIREELKKMANMAPFVVILLTIVFVVLVVAGDNIHQMLDPAYRQKIQEEQKSIREFNDVLKRVEDGHRGGNGQ